MQYTTFLHDYDLLIMTFLQDLTTGWFPLQIIQLQNLEAVIFLKKKNMTFSSFNPEVSTTLEYFYPLKNSGLFVQCPKFIN